MKLYTYTAERSLPRIAVQGIPGTLYGTGMPFWENLQEMMVAEGGEDPDDRMVALEVDTAPIEDRFGVNGEEAWALFEMISEEDGEKKAKKWLRRMENAGGLKDFLELAPGSIVNIDDIPPKYIRVLGLIDPEWDWGADITWPEEPKPVAAWKRPMVTRLLRSIFLPQRKLYGARLGQASVPARDDDPQVIGGVELVWAAGQNVTRGMRGAFGNYKGDHILGVIEERVGRPGKLLGAGKRGAAYRLENGRALKITMDAREVEAAARVEGIRHPNLAMVHKVFVVHYGKRGVGVIVRDEVALTLPEWDEDVSKELDLVLDQEVDKVTESLAAGALEEEGLYRDAMERATLRLRNIGCEQKVPLFLDIADAYRELFYVGVVGLDFGGENFGIRQRRVVLFDYGMAFIEGKQPVEMVDAAPKKAKARA